MRIFLYTSLPMRRIVVIGIVILAVVGIFGDKVPSGGAMLALLRGRTHAPAATSSSSAHASLSTVASSAASSTANTSGIPLSWNPPASLHIPILVYHHVRPAQIYPKSTWSYKMSVTPSAFETQLQWIADHGYTTIDLTTLAQIAGGKIPGPSKPIVITFDDNNRSQWDIAYPALKKHGMMAVFYIVTSRIGHSTITEDELKEMNASGMDIESHTVTHRVLTALNPEDLRLEMADSKKTLEDMLGKPILHLAYPGTENNQAVRDAAQLAGYITATIMDPRPMTASDTNPLRLPRIMMTDDTNLAKVLP